MPVLYGSLEEKCMVIILAVIALLVPLDNPMGNGVEQLLAAAPQLGVAFHSRSCSLTPKQANGSKWQQMQGRQARYRPRWHVGPDKCPILPGADSRPVSFT